MSRKLYIFNQKQFEIKRQQELNKKLNKVYIVQPAHGTVQDRSS